MIELGGEFLVRLAVTIFGPSSRLFPFYLMITLLICAFLYFRRGVSIPFFAWLVPKSIYLHPSHIVDFKVFLVNRLFTVLGLFKLVFLSALIASTIADHISIQTGIGPFHPVVIALLLLVVSDFAVYWVHRAHHENPIIWPFHSLHHSAEVLTPVTLFRKHPGYDLISSLVRGVLIGTLQGVFLVVFDQDATLQKLVGVNMFYVLFNIAGSNLRHSHVWLSFGPVIEHVLISPAQHQIHHSLAPRHHNKNYGEVLAIWDWMFGTLYVPKEMEIIEFGLSDTNGDRVRQPHDSLAAAMIVPLVDSYREIARALGRRHNPTPEAHTEAARKQLAAGSPD